MCNHSHPRCTSSNRQSVDCRSDTLPRSPTDPDHRASISLDLTRSPKYLLHRPGLRSFAVQAWRVGVGLAQVHVHLPHEEFPTQTQQSYHQCLVVTRSPEIPCRVQQTHAVKPGTIEDRWGHCTYLSCFSVPANNPSKYWYMVSIDPPAWMLCCTLVYLTNLPASWRHMDIRDTRQLITSPLLLSRLLKRAV
jgi:hypothetical protein